MPINTPHPKVASMLPRWRLIRQAIEGEDRIKAEGEIYLPRPAGLKVKFNGEDPYESYRLRATYLEAPSKTVAALSGVLNRKPATVVGAPEGWGDRVTKNGLGIGYLAGKTFDELVSVGRRGFLVDGDEEGEEFFVVSYPAESILEVGKSRGRTTTVRLLESRLVPADSDPYKLEPRQSVRRLGLGLPSVSDGLTADERAALGDEPSDQDLWAHHGLMTQDVEIGVYFVEVYEQRTKKEEAEEDSFELVSRVVPRLKGGRFWGEIPFQQANATDVEPEPGRPPLLGICNLALAYYRSSADLEWGLHWASLPTAWAAGFDIAKGGSVAIGSTNAWIAKDPQARAGYLEIKGDGLKLVREAMGDKRDSMVTMGARLLDSGPAGVEAAETVKLRMSGDASFVAHVAANAKKALDQVVRWLGMARGESGFEEFEVEIAKDLDLSKITPQEVTAAVSAYVSGSISFEAFFGILKRGEYYAEGHTIEAEREAIEQGGPMPGNDASA